MFVCTGMYVILAPTFRNVNHKHCHRHNRRKALTLRRFQHLWFKTGAPTSFESLVKLKLCFVWQSARNTKNNFDKFM